MRFKPMIHLAALSVLCCTAAAPLTLCAQEDSAQSAKVLYIVREATKPGRQGEHEKTEAAYVRVLTEGHANMHYEALTSMTGPDRAIFVSAYPSFAAMEAEHKSIGPALGAAMDRANLADGENLTGSEESAWVRRDDLSTNTLAPPAGSHILEVSQYGVKPGHVKQFEDLAKMYIDAAKGNPDIHWTTYELMFGGADGPTFVMLTSHKSAADVDNELTAEKKLGEAMGADGMKKADALEAASVKTEMTNLFIVNPKMSNPTEEMVNADPGFWKPKPAPMKRAAAKKEK